jgi:mannose-1-phosphate guanylyltransferase
MWRRDWTKEALGSGGIDAAGCGVLDEGGVAVASVEPKPRPEANLATDVEIRTAWVIILAGGDGRRLEAITRGQDGTPAPKQFCSFRDDRSLLRATLDRALHLTDREHLIVVVNERHRPWWEVELADLPRENVLAQPENRGTAVAILHALAYIRRRDRLPLLLIMPSDHDVEDEDVLIRKARRALRTATNHEDELVLLGIVPTHIDVDFGLVVPVVGQLGSSRRVMTFVEKPTLSTAAQLMRRGAMWNSFIFACTGRALYALFEDAMPSLLAAYLTAGEQPITDANTLAALFRDLPTRDFSRDLLQREARRLRLIAVPACGWTDLGTPARLAAWLDRHREAAFWHNSGLTRLPGASGTRHARPV